MGLSLRKRSGNIMAGSRLIVEGQPILTSKVFEVGFSGKKGSLPNEHRESPTTTTTTTIVPTPTNTPTPTITPTNSPRPTSTPAVTVSPTSTKTPTPTITQTPTLTKTPTPSVTVTPTNTLTPTPTGGGEPLINPIIVGGDEYLKVGDGEYLLFVDQTPSVTPTPTPTVTSTLTPSVTETPTNTPTNTSTPTNTPTPTTSPIPVTGYGYNLVVLPYAPPTSGNTIFPRFTVTGDTSGVTTPNTFDVNGVYWNAIDNLSVNRTSYYSGMTGTSVTAYFTQNGDTAIYSGSSTAFTFGGPPGQQAFNYDPQVRPGQLILVQSASTNFVTGQTVYISYVVVR